MCSRVRCEHYQSGICRREVNIHWTHAPHSLFTVFLGSSAYIASLVIALANSILLRNHYVHVLGQRSVCFHMLDADYQIVVRIAVWRIKDKMATNLNLHLSSVFSCPYFRMVGNLWTPTLSTTAVRTSYCLLDPCLVCIRARVTDDNPSQFPPDHV